MDDFKNFSYSTVAVAPVPADTGSTVRVQPGHGARFPQPPFNAVVCAANELPIYTNAEIVRVLSRAGDTFTIARRAEAPFLARAILAGDQLYAAITEKTLDDLARAQAPPGYWTPITDGAPVNTQLLFDSDGNCVVGFVPTAA